MKKLFAAEINPCEVQLTNGDKADIVIRELTIPETEELFTLMLDAAFHAAINRGDIKPPGVDGISDAEKLTLSDTMDSPSKFIFELFPHARARELILGRNQSPGASWLELISPSNLADIVGCFIEINPFYQQKKRDFEKRLRELNTSPTIEA